MPGIMRAINLLVISRKAIDQLAKSLEEKYSLPADKALANASLIGDTREKDDAGNLVVRNNAGIIIDVLSIRPA